MMLADGWGLLGWSCGMFAAFVVAVIIVGLCILWVQGYLKRKRKSQFNLSMRDTRPPGERGN